MGGGPSEFFEFGEPYPNSAVDVDRWVGMGTRWMLETLAWVLFHPPPTRIQALQAVFNVYSWHVAGIFSLLLLVTGFSLHLHTFLQIQLLVYLFILCAIPVYWLCCLVLDYFSGIFNVVDPSTDDLDEDFFFEDVFDDDFFGDDFFDQDFPTDEDGEFEEY